MRPLLWRLQWCICLILPRIRITPNACSTNGQACYARAVEPRALYALLHGEVAAAWKLNPVLLLLPFLLAAMHVFSQRSPESFSTPRGLSAAGLFMILFTLVRNLS